MKPTEKLINELRKAAQAWAPLGGALYAEAAERLELLDAHDHDLLRTTAGHLTEQLAGAIKERDQARAEMYRAKTEIERWKNHIGEMMDATDSIRPEPSRLEIAAMLVAGRFSNTTMLAGELDQRWIQYAIKAADALIAAAKETTK